MATPTEIKIRLWQVAPGEWQADLEVDPGYRAAGKTPWDALVRLADYCQLHA